MISGVISPPTSGFRFEPRKPALAGGIRDGRLEAARESRPVRLRSRVRSEPEADAPAVGLHMVHKASGLLDPMG